MKLKAIGEAAGRKITRLYKSWQEPPLEVGAEVPTIDKLLQFEVRDWLVLCNYGDDKLPKPIRERIFGIEKAWTVAVNRKTGEIGITHYFTEKDDEAPSTLAEIDCLLISRWPFDILPTEEEYRFPEGLLHKLDNLKSLKRPFAISIEPEALMGILDHEIGYSQIYGNVTFTFRVEEDSWLEVCGSYYRRVTPWKGLDDG